MRDVILTNGLHSLLTQWQQMTRNLKVTKRAHYGRMAAAVACYLVVLCCGSRRRETSSRLDEHSIGIPALQKLQDIVKAAGCMAVTNRSTDRDFLPFAIDK
eukprot:207721-Amphidinium_carterae.1